MNRDFCKKGKFRLTAKVILAIWAAFFIGCVVYGEMSSGNYKIMRSVIGAGGGERSSSGYTIKDTLAEAFIETTEGTDYIIRSGFWAFFIPKYSLSGTVIFEYPIWVPDTALVMYQVREPGLPPTDPISKGTLSVAMTPGDFSASGSFTITDIPDGTYDVALKCQNRTAGMVPDVAVAGSDVTGLEFTLWAGDADGDDNPGTVYEEWDNPDPPLHYDSDPEGDNDVDLMDYYTLYYQYVGGVPVTTGYNADFDRDGDIDLGDYYGFKYGRINNPDPGNWYYP